MHLRIPILIFVIVAAFFTARVTYARGGGGGHGGGGHGGGHGGHGGGHHGGDHGHGGHDHGHGDHGYGHHGWDHHGWGHHGWNHGGWGGGWGGWGAYGYGYDPGYYFPAYGYCNYDAPSVTNNYTENDTETDSQDSSQDSTPDASYNGPVTVEAGWTELASGQDDDAEDIFDEVLDRNPDSGVARVGLALSMASMGDLPRSVRELRQAVGTRPQALDKVPDDNQQLNAQIDSILARYQGSLSHASNQSDPNFAIAVLQYMRGRKKMSSDALNAAVAAGDTSQSAKNLRTLIQGN